MGSSTRSVCHLTTHLLSLLLTPLQAMLPWDAEDKPGPGWPGKTAVESNQAWPVGQQPANLIAWPREQGRPQSCWKVTLLHDTVEGWPGKCEDLPENLAARGNEHFCEKTCTENPECMAWQFTMDGSCLQGSSLQCHLTGSSSVPLQRAQWLQHGDVRVIRNMTGWDILNLRPLGIGSGASDQATQIEHCRDYCYSLLGCEYWTFAQSGCFAEDPTAQNSAGMPHVAQYPLTLSGASNTSELALTVVAGEFIQHICPAKQSSQDELGGFSFSAVILPKSGPDRFSFFLTVAMTVLATCLVVGCAVFSYWLYLRNSHDEDAAALQKRSICAGSRGDDSEESNEGDVENAELADRERRMKVTSASTPFADRAGSWRYMPVDGGGRSPLPSQENLGPGSVPPPPMHNHSFVNSFNTVGSASSFAKSSHLLSTSAEAPYVDRSPSPQRIL
eukprot:TRINITY_DN17036_c0_g1_i1.p1 TRINITY_DN17036_c0_g1~~TRINITY_DN17036_c0_g1_i1.p1  ORF type:complete len:446 (+),score=58.44 TRINITY_DN17036_c0_g1_i1:77-1414(+)